jgi:hypothetical protein
MARTDSFDGQQFESLRCGNKENSYSYTGIYLWAIKDFQLNQLFGKRQDRGDFDGNIVGNEQHRN